MEFLCFKFLGNSCPSGQTCKSFAQCPAQSTSQDIQSCDLNGNGLGICCKDNTSAAITQQPIPKCQTTSDSPNPSQPCIFPFKFYGRTFSGELDLLKSQLKML